MEALNERISTFVAEHAEAHGRSEFLVGFSNIGDIPSLGYLEAFPGFAVSIAVALDPRSVAGISDGRTGEYFSEYASCGKFVERLEGLVAEFLCGQGCKAEPLRKALLKVPDPPDGVDRSTRLPAYRTIAIHAGLGWVGKNGLVITKHYGPAVQLATILTDAPLDCSTEVFLSRCGRCMECIAACPVKAIRNIDRASVEDFSSMVDLDACREECHRKSLANDVEVSICGCCTISCPYTRSYLRRNGH